MACDNTALFSTEEKRADDLAEEELKTVDLGDKRLNNCPFLLAERLSESPSRSIPAACSGWTETQGAYRFLAQDGIGWEDVLAPHFECTIKRMTPHRVVLCIQDTTELDFNGQEIEGGGLYPMSPSAGCICIRPMR